MFQEGEAVRPFVEYRLKLKLGLHSMQSEEAVLVTGLSHIYMKVIKDY